jgi:hypothetical protein
MNLMQIPMIRYQRRACISSPHTSRLGWEHHGHNSQQPLHHRLGA